MTPLQSSNSRASGLPGGAPAPCSEPSALLLVEDDEQDAALVQHMLSTVGDVRDIVHVLTLQGAVEKLSSSTFAAVLLDLRLPDGVGVQCLQAVLAVAPQVPIVVLTGLQDTELGLRCVAQGAQDYLSKQELRPSVLRRSVDYACARMRERQRADAFRRRLASVVEVSRDGILTVDSRGLVTTWNRGAERILGKASSEVVGRPLSEAVAVGGSEPSVRSWQRLHEHAVGAGARTEFELVLLRKEAAPIDVSVVTCRLPGTADVPEGGAAIIRDITRSKRQDRELRERNEELVRRDGQMRALAARLNATREEERTRISRVVHDELGQLLTAIKMDLRWVRRRLATETGSQAPVLERLAEGEELVDRTVRTVQSIAVELRPSVLDSLGLAAAIRDEARRFEQRTSIETSVSVRATSNPYAEAATALFRVLQELLTNVARHAGAGSCRISLEDRDREWTLCVEDDGVGLAKGGGRLPSLGLLGVRERAESLGGSFALTARPSGGTVACARIPQREDSPIAGEQDR